jgi:hypothetical protein
MTVKPSAQPTLVRTQHLPHKSPGQPRCRVRAYPCSGAVRDTAAGASAPGTAQIAAGQRPGRCRASRPGGWFAENTRRRSQAPAACSTRNLTQHAAAQSRPLRLCHGPGGHSPVSRRVRGTVARAVPVSRDASPRGHRGLRRYRRPSMGTTEGDQRQALPSAQMATERRIFVCSGRVDHSVVCMPIIRLCCALLSSLG